MYNNRTPAQQAGKDKRRESGRIKPRTQRMQTCPQDQTGRVVPHKKRLHCINMMAMKSLMPVKSITINTTTTEMKAET